MTSLSQFSWDCPSFKTQSPMSWDSLPHQVPGKLGDSWSPERDRRKADVIMLSEARGSLNHYFESQALASRAKEQTQV